MQETLPVGLSLTPTQSLDMVMTSDGPGLQGGAACLELGLRQEKWRQPLLAFHREVHLKAVKRVTREDAETLEIRHKIVKIPLPTSLERN